MNAPFAAQFEIAGRTVGNGAPCYVIAEAGVAHFGSLEKAFRLVDLAADAGADAVKFQIFSVEAMISNEAPQWRTRMQSRHLPSEAFFKIRDHCRERRITFFATAHDEPSLAVLDQLDVPVYKIGSGEVGNWPFLAAIARRGKPVILSTGMYTIADVRAALNIFAEVKCKDLAVLHCVTRYPTLPGEANLRAMDTIREQFGVTTGLSDHTAGFHIPLAAVARGATVLEKHITLDFDVPDAQDWRVSCGPETLAPMIRQIRDIEAALGTGEKVPAVAESESLAWARKSLVAAVNIAAGETVTAEKLVAKRPGTGLPPADLPRVAGRRAKVDIAADTLIRLDQLA